MHCTSKKPWPILYSNILYNMGQDFCAVQYPLYCSQQGSARGRPSIKRNGSSLTNIPEVMCMAGSLCYFLQTCFFVLVFCTCSWHRLSLARESTLGCEVHPHWRRLWALRALWWACRILRASSTATGSMHGRPLSGASVHCLFGAQALSVVAQSREEACEWPSRSFARFASSGVQVWPGSIR